MTQAPIFLKPRDLKPMTCAYGIDNINGAIYYMDVDFRFNEVEIHQANVLSHQCTRKVVLSKEMFGAIGKAWDDFRQHEAAKNEPEDFGADTKQYSP